MGNKKTDKAVFMLLKLLQPVFGVLFYAAIFFIVLSLILLVMVLIVNVETDQLLLAPFMGKITDEAGEITAYSVSFGNGIKIITDTVELGEIKSTIYAGIFVFICALFTAAPIFKLFSLLLENINSKETAKITSKKTPKYIIYIGLCFFAGNILTKFVARFYNYYLAVKFIKSAPQEIKLSLGFDITGGITGLAIILIGIVSGYIFDYIRPKETGGEE